MKSKTRFHVFYLWLGLWGMRSFKLREAAESFADKKESEGARIEFKVINEERERD